MTFSEYRPPLTPAQALPPLWRLGFRPFFLFACVFALVGIALWVAIFTGTTAAIGPMDPILWHAHEMIYGYTTAVIAGFVLTASQNWTGKAGLRGAPLALLTGVWILGRVLMSVTSQPNPWVAIIDLSFFPALALVMFPYLRPSDMKVERVFFLYFALFFSGNLVMHLELLGYAQGYALQGALLGLHTATLMILFMGGRVIPFFTESERAQAQPRVRPPVELLAHASAWAFLATQVLIPYSTAAGVVAIATGLLHLVRLAGWYVSRVRRVAILWVLYSSYLWIVVGFVLTGLLSLRILPIGPPVHALTVGGIGIMTYGMMSRVALGHTGRKLQPSGWTITGYVLLNVACAIRVFAPILNPARLGTWVLLSGVLWGLAFATLLFVYAPMLLRARADGRPG